MKLTLKRKVIGLTLFAAFLHSRTVDPDLRGETAHRQTVDRELNELIRGRTRNELKDVYRMCQVTDALIQGQVNRNLRIAGTIVEQLGGIHELPGEMVGGRRPTNSRVSPTRSSCRNSWWERLGSRKPGTCRPRSAIFDASRR